MSSILKRSELEDVTMSDLMQRAKSLSLALWARTSRRMRIAGAFLLFSALAIALSVPTLQRYGPGVPLPKVSFEYAGQQAKSPYNESKVALLIENRPFPILAPLMLHFMAVVPPDWRFRFMGSVDSVEHINKSVAIREQVAAGKLDLTYIPANMTTGSQEEISRFLTTLWLYEYVLQPAEWLLVFQTDSILCANSQHNINEFMQYDWVGAPWNPNGRFGGNGGLSIRRVSAIIDILRHQVRVPGSEPEDVWLADRLGHHPGSKLANGTISLTFSGEMYTGEGAHLNKGPAKGSSSPGDNNPSSGGGGGGGKKYNSSTEAAADGKLVAGIDDWREGFYEPMGYHTGGSGQWLHSAIWGTPALRKHIWDYCPEVKMTLAMDAAKFVPGACGGNWKKRDLDGEYEMVDRGGGDDDDDDELATSGVDLGWGTEVIDGTEYPLLPPTLKPW